MVGGARSATHFIVSPSAWHPPHAHTHTHTHTQCTSTYTQDAWEHTHTHTHQGFTSTQTQTDIAAAVSPQGVNINICPCHTHIKVKVVGSCGHTCGSVRGIKCEKNSAAFSLFWFSDFFFFFKKLPGGFITKTFDRRPQLYRRRATQRPTTLQFEQSVKGKKEINSTLTNVNKVLSGQQRRIDSIKRANVPLACLSFNYITGSLLHILPRGQPILHHICVYIWAPAHMCGYVRACIITSVCVCVCACVCVAFMFACGQHHFTFIEMSSPPWGACAALRPAAMLASIDSPGLGLGWGCLSPVAPARWPAPRQSSGGERRVSSPGHRLGAPSLPVETGRRETIRCVFARARGHAVTQAQVCSAETPIRKTCHMWQVDAFLSGISHKTEDSCLGLVWFFCHTLIVNNICSTCFSWSHTELIFPINTV